MSESDTGRELEIFEKEKKRTYIVLQFAVGIDTSICRERNRSRVHFGHGFDIGWTVDAIEEVQSVSESDHTENSLHQMKKHPLQKFGRKRIPILPIHRIHMLFQFSVSDQILVGD